MDAYLQRRAWDEAIARLATDQHGVVAAFQLFRLGVSRSGIAVRLQRGRLHPVHRGVYAVGHRVLTQRGQWMAAALAYGPSAVVSHRSAAALWGILPVTSRAIEITVPAPFHHRRNLQVHRAILPPDETTTRDGIPATTVPRTILDLAAVAPRRQVERTINEAEVQRLHDALSVPDLIVRYRGRRGTRMLSEILAAGRIGLDITRSELEEAFLTFLDEYGLPRPELNVSIWLLDRWIQADCAWRAQRVLVELDGRAAHDTAVAFERDRARDRSAAAAGWRPVRVTWQALHGEHRSRLAADLRALLAA